jgi:outer membrane protein insertion porin family
MKNDKCKLVNGKCPVLALCLLLLPLYFAPAALAADLSEFAGRRVARVDVVLEGATEADTSELRSLIEISAGQEFSAVAIRDSLTRLYSSGLISRGRVEAEAVGAREVALRFVVSPQPRIERVIFQGETEIPASEMRSRLNRLDPGQRLTAGAVAQGAGELQALYSSRGYLQARVDSLVRLNPEGTRATVAYTIEPGEQARVSDYRISFTGPQIDLSEIEHEIVEGEPFLQSAVQAEAERIRQAYIEEGYLAVRTDANTTPDPVRNRVAVSLSVEPGPKVEVEVEGLELSEEKEREILPFYTGAGLDEFTLEEGRRRLLEYAQQQGYFFAEVQAPRPPDLSAASARLNYVVEPGRRFKLSDIDIEGLDDVPIAGDELRDRLNSETASWIPFFGPDHGITSDDLLRRDASVIAEQLRAVGYRRAQVEVLRGISPTGDNLIITFDVEPGPRTYIEEIGLRGNRVLSTDELLSGASINVNDPYVESEVNRTADQLLDDYTSLGYADAQVYSEFVELGNYEGRDRVRLIYNVSEGNRVRIASVSTRGNARTSTSRLEKDFYTFKSGDWLRRQELQETERLLYETNAFNSVAITTQTLRITDDGIEEREVAVNVVESRPNLLIYSVGFQSSSSDLEVPGLGFLNGARGLVQISNTNLLGKLYTGTAQLRASSDELLGQLSFQNPQPFGYRWPTIISLFARRLAQTTFNSDRYTALIQTQRQLSPISFFYFAYNFERISIYNQMVGLEEVERNRRPIRLGRITPSYARDTRDKIWNPTEGTLTLGSFSVASSALGGNEQFVKFLVEHSRYYPLLRRKDLVYSVAARMGLASPFGGDDSLPISERFFAGGPRDLRGFGFEEAGPRDPETGRPIGGNAVIVINNELRFPIWSILGGTLFADTGNVFRRVRDISFSGLTQTLGFGLRIDTPIGPIRVDIGALVANRPPGAPNSRVHFTFGQAF